jgi:ABC-type lipoprotein export system ATPase subunit
MKKSIVVSNLGLSYGKGIPALDGVNFSLNQNDALAIVGPSGCGKSSLLAIMGGLQRPTVGHLYHHEQDVYGGTSSDLDDYRARTVGFVFQSPCLLPHLTLLENVLLPVDHLNSELPLWHSKAMELLGKVGIADLASRRPREVSGGQAQRAAIARALLRDPAMILADEPTGALDGVAAHQVLDLLLRFHSDGACLVVVTHDKHVADQIPSRLALSHGRVIEAAIG